MTTLITGGAGLIGAEIARLLADRGEPVVCFDLEPGAFAPDGVEVVTGDIATYEALDRAVEVHDVDRLVHTAAIIGRSSTHANPTRALQVDGVGTDNAFRTAVEHDLDRIVWASTLGVYGPAEAYPSDAVDEEAPAPAAYTVFEGSSFYRALKQLNEFQSLVYHADHGVDALGIRPSVVFGPQRDRGWLGRVVEEAHRDGEATIDRPPGARLSLVYMADVADLFVRVLLADAPRHQVYNTGGNTVTARELADAVEAATGAAVACTPDAPEKPSPAVIEHDRATDEFGYAVTPLDEAVADYLDRLDAAG